MKDKLILFFALLLLLPSVIALEGMSEKFTEKSNGEWTLGSYTYVSQNFTIGTNGANTQFNVTKIGLSGYETSGGSKIVVRIGTTKGGEEVANGTLTDLPDTSSWFNVSISYWNTSAFLLPDKMYYLSVKNINGNMQWNNNDTSVTYSGGNAMTPTTQYIDSDTLFIIYGTPNQSVSLSYPTNNAYNTFTPANLTATIYGNSLVNATAYVWDSNNNLVNTTTIPITESSVKTFEIYNLRLDTYKWNVVGCEASGCFQALTNFTFTNGYKINTASYNLTVPDGTLTGFVLNVTIDNNLVGFASGTFKYANTEYTSTIVESGSERLFYNSITTPPVQTSTAKAFNWSIYLSDTTTSIKFNSSTYTQTVTPTNFTICPNFYPAVNYTVLDEETNKPINVSFGGTFQYALSPTANQKNYSYSGDGFSFIFCISANATFFVDGDIILTKTGYIDKVYRIRDASYSNTTTTRYLYMLNDTIGSDIKIHVVDSGYVALSNYLVKIYRYREETGTYDLVSEQITDSRGLFLATLVENTVDYKFEFYDPSGNLIRTEQRTNIICPSSDCLFDFVIIDTNNYAGNYLDLENYEYSLSFSNASKTFVFSFSDGTGDTGVSHRLKVTRFINGDAVIVCNNITTALTTSLTCTVGTDSYPYIAQAFRTATNQDEKQIDVLSIIVSHTSDLFGREGLFWIVIALGIIVATAVFSPVTSVILFIAGIMFFALSGFIYVPPIAIIVLMAIGGFFAWAFKT